jgi:hypothetical protein
LHASEIKNCRASRDELLRWCDASKHLSNAPKQKHLPLI